MSEDKLPEWDKLWKEKPIASNEFKASDYTLTRYGKWIKQVKTVGDKREQRIKELEQENKQLQMKIETARGTLQLLTDLLNQRHEKLEAKHGLVKKWDKNEIYAVSSGEYSDYSVDFLTFDKSGAEKYVADMNKYERHPEYQLEEFEIKNPIPKIKHYCSVSMKKNGDTHYATIVASEKYTPWKITYVNFEWRDDGGYIAVDVPGTNLDKAVRIVNEIRVKMLHHNKWGDDEFIQELRSVYDTSPTTVKCIVCGLEVSHGCEFFIGTSEEDKTGPFCSKCMDDELKS